MKQLTNVEMANRVDAEGLGACDCDYPGMIAELDDGTWESHPDDTDSDDYWVWIPHDCSDYQ